MSPVNRAGSVSEIVPRHSFLRKISMCLHGKPGWPGYRDLGFCDRVLENRDIYIHIFVYTDINPPALVTGTRNLFDEVASLSQHNRTKMVYVFCLACIPTAEV